MTPSIGSNMCHILSMLVRYSVDLFSACCRILSAPPHISITRAWGPRMVSKDVKKRPRKYAKKWPNHMQTVSGLGAHHHVAFESRIDQGRGR